MVQVLLEQLGLWMVNARAKGAAFERECAKKINAMLETTHIKDRVSRNLNQYQEKNQPDLKLRYIYFECKNYARNSNNWYQEKWWRQVCEAAGDENTPILIFKFNHLPIRVAFPLSMLNSNICDRNYHHPVAFTSFDEFLDILKYEVQTWKS
mgnify:FL=1